MLFISIEKTKGLVSFVFCATISHIYEFLVDAENGMLGVLKR
ncbi:hypothetical protein SPWS13_4608 [Shewanella putrefaciens]|nr:hypothetical protein SPWS13_4608 [Shewanella putrefaciens]